MAVCEIWDVRGRLDHPIDYAENPEKTANPKYTEADLQAMVDVMEYATNKNKNGLPVLSTAKLIKIPMARLPASPIIRRLGVALYHKYPRIHTTNSRMIYGNCVSLPRIWSIT